MRFTRFLVAVVTGLMTHVCMAQETFAPPDCIFKSFWTPTASGTGWVRGVVEPSPGGAKVSFRAWWCPQSGGTWAPYIHRCVEGRTCLSASVVEHELDTAARSADKLAALRDAVQRYQSQPLPNEWPDWDRAGVVAKSLLEPIKPAGPAAEPSYVVSATQAFPLKPDGTRSTTPWTPPPIKGETCDCTGTNKIVQYGATFCKVPRLSTTQTIVAGCSLKKP